MQIKINCSVILYLNICTAFVSMSLLCNAMCYKRNSFFGFKFPDSIDHPLKTISLRYQNLLEIHIRRGGSSQMVNHSEWLDTIDSEPDIISMHLLPLTSLLGGISGIGYLTHAINLYLRCK
jgi:hypothetical protein